jgi:hypothetical protein
MAGPGSTDWQTMTNARKNLRMTIVQWSATAINQREMVN